MYGYYITQKGADLMAQAVVDESKVTITQCAVGDGGDAEAEKDLSRTALNNETYRKSFDIEDSYALAPDDSDTVMIECVIPSEAGELTVSEIGFLDESDNLIAYGVLKEQVLGSDSDGLEYSLDIVSFIELTSEQLSVLKVDLGKANVQAISERVDEFESTVNTTVDDFKSDINNSITTFESTVNQSVQNFEDSVDEFKTDVNGQLDGFRDDIKNLDLGTELKEDLQALEERVNSYHPAPAYLCDGSTFNTKIKAIEGYDTATSLIFTLDSPGSSKTLTDVSRDGDSSVVAWVDNTTIYVSAYGKLPYANENSYRMFYSFTNLTSINLTYFNTSQSTTMAYMFQHCSNLKSLDLSGFDTKLVTSMGNMFNNCSSLISLDLSSFDTSKVSIMQRMFYECSNLTHLDISSFNTSKVYDMREMFYSCMGLTSIDLSHFDTPELLDMNSMFRKCSNLREINLSNFNLSNVVSKEAVYYTFYQCYELTTIYANDWVSTNNIIIDGYYTFTSCTKLPGYISGNNSGAYCKLIADGGYFTDPSLAPPKPAKKTLKEVQESLEALEQKVNQYHPEPVLLCDASSFNSKLEAINGWSNVTSIVFTDKVPSEDKSTTDLSLNKDNSVVAWSEETTAYISGKGKIIQAPSECDSMFSSFSAIKSIDLTYLDTSKTTRMSQMFYGCSSLVSIDPSQIDTSSATSLAKMFNSCKALITMDLTTWDTKNVDHMNSLFNSCTNLQEVNMGNLDTSSLTTTDNMFRLCSNLTSVNLSHWNTSKITNMSDMFAQCASIETISLSSFTTESLTNSSYMINSCKALKSLNLKNFNPTGVTDSTGMFSGDNVLSDIYCDYDWSTNSTINSSSMFNNCSSLPDWSSSKITGAYAKPVADGGYFKPSSEAPPDPEKKSIEERLKALEEALKGGVATSSSFNYLEYAQFCQIDGEPFGDKVTSNPFFQSYYKSGFKDQGCLTVKAKNDCYLYSSDVVTNETSRSVTAGETIKLEIDYSDLRDIHYGYYTISFGKDPSEYMVELDTPDVLVVGVAQDPG